MRLLQMEKLKVVMKELSVITASEAMWHLLAFKLSECSHAVTPLSVHEEFKESVLLEEGKEEEVAEKLRKSEATSALTAWFVLNKVVSVSVVHSTKCCRKIPRPVNTPTPK